MFYIYRCTTDKLDVGLNSIVEAGDTVVQPVHIGGRDWVVVCRKGHESPFADSWADGSRLELREAQKERDKYAALTREVERRLEWREAEKS